MGVIDGQDVDQAVTNPAFINKNVDDVMPNKLGFSRIPSGASISDIQAAVNRLYTASGANDGGTTGTGYVAPASTINVGDPYVTAFSKLAQKFDPVTGHMHTGSAGDGPQINLSFGVTGTLPIVLGGTSATSASGAWANLVQIASTGALGAVYLSAVAAQSVGTANTVGTINGTVANADHAHQGIHSLAATGQTALFGDVVLQAGSNISLSQSGQNISIAASASVSSIAVTGSSPLTGAVVLQAGSGVSLTQTGQDILVSASATGSYIGPVLVAVTGTSTLLGTHQYVEVSATGNCTINLPAATALQTSSGGNTYGLPILITNKSAFIVAISGHTTDTIDGATGGWNLYGAVTGAPVSATQYSSMTLYPNVAGNGWNVT